jgi:predicted membrane protein
MNGSALRGPLLPAGILILLGVLFLLDNLEVVDFGDVIGVLWPLALIGLGVWLLLATTRGRAARPATATRGATAIASEVVGQGTGEYARVSAFLGSAKQTVSSTAFRGGSATAVLGEVVLDLRSARLSTDGAVLSVTCVVGDVKVKTPADWAVEVNGSPALGNVKDKRRMASAPPPAAAQTPLLRIDVTALVGDLTVED